MKCVVCGCVRAEHEAMEVQNERLTKRVLELQDGTDIKILEKEHDEAIDYLHYCGVFDDFKKWLTNKEQK